MWSNFKRLSDSELLNTTVQRVCQETARNRRVIGRNHEREAIGRVRIETDSWMLQQTLRRRPAEADFQPVVPVSKRDEHCSRADFIRQSG